MQEHQRQRLSPIGHCLAGIVELSRMRVGPWIGGVESGVVT